MSLPLKTCSDGEPTASALFLCSVILRKLPNFELPFWRFGSRSPLSPPPPLSALPTSRGVAEPSPPSPLPAGAFPRSQPFSQARGLGSLCCSCSGSLPLLPASPQPRDPLSRCSPPSSISPRNVHKCDNFRPFPNPAAQCARSPPQLCPHGWGLCTPCTPTAPTSSNPGRPGPVHRGAAAALTPRRCGWWEPEPKVGALTGGWGLS